MVHTLDGNSEIGVRVRSKLSYLLCLKHVIRSREQSHIGYFISENPYFLHACATKSDLPSNMGTMVEGIYANRAYNLSGFRGAHART